MFEDLKTIIEFIDKNYKITNEQWISFVSLEKCINLKKETVNHAQKCLNIRNYIFNYVDFLPKIAVDILCDANNLELSKSKFRSRIKTKNSVNAKMDTYLKRENGNFPIMILLRNASSTTFPTT